MRLIVWNVIMYGRSALPGSIAIVAVSLLALPAVAAPLFVEQTAALGAQPCSGADVGCYTNYLQMADVTGDGKLDLLFANAKGYFFKVNPAEPIVILRNDGGFGFTDISTHLDGGFTGWVRQIAIGDVNGDGSLDLFAPSAWGDADAFFINDGSGNFTDEAATRIEALHSRAGATRFADVDGDGDLDLLISDWGPNPFYGTSWSMHLWLNDGTGHFTNADARLPVAASLPSGTPVDIDLADVDGDFDLDLLIDTHNGSVQLWLNDGGGTFSDATASHFVATPTGLHYNPVACDVDGDGDLDVFVDNARGSGANEQLLINDGTGHFTDGTAARLGAIGDAGSDDNGVACIDVNGDGHFDAAVASLSGNERVLINDGGGRFTLSPDAFPVVKDPTLWFDFGDLDGDGRLDAVTGQGEQRGLGGWINRLYVGTAGMVADTLPPQFRVVESLPAQYAADPVRVRFAVSDGATSDTGPRLTAAFVRYSISGAAPLSVPATFMGGDLFRAVVAPTIVNANVSYEACAVDLAGNSACAAAKSYLSEVALCNGDCDGSGNVTVSELITSVNIALGNTGLSTCVAGDADRSGEITISEIVQAVDFALNGCPAH